MVAWVKVMKDLGYYDIDISRQNEISRQNDISQLDNIPPQSGVLVVGRDYKDSEISFSQVLDVEKAKRLGASAVYFQQFPDTGNTLSDFRPAAPQIYIFDKSEEEGGGDGDVLTGIHKKLWSGSIVPVYYVLTQTQVKIYSARQPITMNTANGEESLPDAIDECPLSNIVQTKRIIDTYHAKMFRTGNFWKQDSVKQYFSDKETVGEKLLQQIRRVRETIIKRHPDSDTQNAICHLLMLGIFVKYLEERMDSMGKKVLPDDFFAKFGANDFCDAVRKGRLTDVLESLGNRFNGEIFSLDMDPCLRKGVAALNDPQNLRSFAGFLDARTEGRQYVLWRLYDFNYIPVEIISRIYEEFVFSKGGQPGLAYTPASLANLIIDECMPLHRPKPKIKICDPACGSGIFLVTAFRRLVHWRQYEEYKNGNRGYRPDATELKNIMHHSIHGYDIQPMAVNLSVFSLSIAMCDMLEPAKIWTSLKFDNLRKKNLVKDDFFSMEAKKGKFDLIVGNPPFEDAPKKDRGNRPHHNNAISFLLNSMKILTEDGNIAFVMPAMQILYGNTRDRHNFFHNHYVKKVMDFSFFRGTLFEKKNISSVVLFAMKEMPRPGACTSHTVVRRTFNADQRIMFEVDAYDIHQIPLFLTGDARVWKSNLLGGAAVYDVVLKLASYKTLQTFLDDRKADGWMYSVGYSTGGSGAEKIKAEWLTGKKVISSWGKGGSEDTFTEGEKKFARPRNELLYKSPHLLIRTLMGREGVDTLVDDKSYRFRSSIIGIATPSKCSAVELNNVFRENREIHRFFLLATSYRAGVGRGSSSTVQMKDIMALPVPADSRAIALSEDEEIVVKDVTDYAPEALDRKVNLKIDEPTLPETVEFYMKTYCNQLNNWYADKGREFRADCTKSEDGAICVAFKYCKKREGVWPSGVKKQIAKNDFTFINGAEHSSIAFRRVFVWTGVEHTIIYIRPNARRYWLGSVALRDAAGFRNDIERRGS